MQLFHTLTCNWASSMFGEQVKEAVRLAKLTGCRIQFEFNGVTVKVESDSDPQYLYTDYMAKLKAGK